MKVLYFTKYTNQGASSRLRSYQYFAHMEQAGISVTVKPFFSNLYLEKLYKGNTDKIELLKAYLKRFVNLFTVFSYDVIVIEKELFPYFFSWFEKMLYVFRIKYIVDYDDAIFHNYDLSKSKVTRFLLANKIDNVMKYSHCLIAGNAYLAKRGKNVNAKRIVIIPTVIDIDRYTIKADYCSSQINIGWVGSPSTFKYVKNISNVLVALMEKHNVTLTILGAKGDLNLDRNVNFIPWTEDSEVSSILKFDIGIMPLENTPWEFGKCSYKLIQYMGCGIPVVASAVGMNNVVVQHSENGFLANSEQEWFLYLEKLILDEHLRRDIGLEGRKKVMEFYTLQQMKKKLISIIRDAAN